MSRWIKYIGIPFAAVLLLFLGALAVVPMVFDPNDLKGTLIRQVEGHTGRKLEIAGDLRLSLFPWVGVEIAGLRLSNPEGFGDGAFALVERAAVRARLMPLLERRVEVGTLILEGLELNLVRREDGSANWDGLGGKGEAAPVGGKESTPPASSPEAALEGLSIGGIEVKRGRVSWLDRTTGQEVRVDIARLSTGAIAGDHPVAVHMELEVGVEGKAPQVTGRMELDASVQLDRRAGQIAIKGLRLAADAQGKALQGGAAHAEFGGDLEVLAEALGAPVRGWQLRSKGLQLKGGLRQPELQSTFVVSTPLTLDGDSGRLEAPSLRLDAEAKGERVQGRAVKGQGSAGVLYGMKDGSLELRNLVLAAGELNLSGDLRGRIGEKPAVSGSLKVAELNLRRFLTDWGIPLPPTSDPNTLARFAADLEVQSEGASTKVSRLLVTLDETQIAGSAAIKGKAVTFNLNLNAIDLDRYRPAEAPSPVAAQPAAEAQGSRGADRPLLPPETVETLRGLDLDGVVGVERLVLGGLKGEGVRLELKAKGGRIEASPKVGKFYQGTFNGITRLDITGAEPRITAEKHLAGVQVGPLLHDAKGEDRLSGTLNFNSSVQTGGNSVAALKGGLDGKLDLSLTNGSVKGVNLAQVLREAKAKLSGGTVSPAPQQTDFSEVTGSATLQKGILSNQDLMAKSPYLRVDGKGTVDLPQERLDYAVTATVVSSGKGQGGEGLEELVGIPIPVRLAGPLAAPQYTVDMERVLAELAKSRLRDAAEAELQKRAQGGKSGDFVDKLKKSLPGGIKLPF